MNREEFQYLLVGRGNGSIGLNFGVDFVSSESAAIGTKRLKSDDSFDFEVPWKELFFDCETIHMWGLSPARRRFYDVLRNVTSGRPSLFKC